MSPKNQPRISVKRLVFSFTSAYFQGPVNLKQTAYPSTSTLSMVLQNSLYSICQTVVYLVIADPLEKKCRNYASLTHFFDFWSTTSTFHWRSDHGYCCYASVNQTVCAITIFYPRNLLATRLVLGCAITGTL